MDTGSLVIASTLVTIVLVFVYSFLYMRVKKYQGKIVLILSASYIFWGIIIATYPLYKTMKTFHAAISYFAVGVIGFAVSISLLTAYFQKLREELICKDQKIRYLGMYDKLTGVYSRAYFEELLQNMDNFNSLPLSVIIGDLNCLKLINDIFGHQRGDQLLVDAVNIIKKSCRKKDIIARWGGDEFIILLPETGFENAQHIIQKIKENANVLVSEKLPLDISLGAATKWERCTDFSTVLGEADEEMYRNKLMESKKLRNSIIRFLEKILWEKDYQTEEHVMRLKELVIKTGQYLGLSRKAIEELTLVASLHDIGKIIVPEEILRKPGPLTCDEWNIIKKHPETGYRIARSTSELVHISDSILSHHEWWNGKGYPQGLQGDEISLYARITAVVDSYDVMTHSRPYRKALSKEEALQEIEKCAGTQFDPEIARAFINMLTKLHD